MANNTIYPYGTNGELPSSIGIVNDLYTGGADKALSAEMGKELNEEINKWTPKDLSSITEEKAFIATSTETWASGYDSWKCKFTTVSSGQVYVIKGNAERSSYVAVLQDNSHTNGAAPNYATGQGLVRIIKNTYYRVTIPTDGSYLYVATLSNSNDCTPQSVSLEESVSSKFEKDVDIINSQRVPDACISSYPGWFIRTDNKWDNTGGAENYECELVRITPGNDYIIVGGETGGPSAVLSSATKSTGSSPDFCSDYPSRFRVQEEDCFVFTAPEDAAYIYITRKTNGDTKSTYVAIPKTVDKQFQELKQGDGSGEDNVVGSIAVSNIAAAVGNKLYPLNPELDDNGYEVAETIQELNVTRKAEQMTDVVWTPLLSVPYHTWNNPNLYFPADVPVTGLPYSSVKELDKFIMKDVSLHTFMTAVKNPYSLLYTENVSTDNSKSAWGKTYHGLNASCYFGTVCSEFTAICSGNRFDYGTAAYEWLSKNHFLVKVYDQTAQGARRGDIFWKEGHCRLIYSVKKNNLGVVTHVRIAESTYGTCIINSPITASAFNTEISNGCILYRPLWLFKNIDYVASPYVPVGDETPQTVTYNDDICTFAGDKAAFRDGDLVVLNYNLTESPSHTWTHIQVYKGSTLLNTYAIADIDQSTLDDSQKNHALSLGTSLAYGKYKARMTDGTNYSDYTQWEVIQTSVSVSINEGVATITASSSNATKKAVKVCPVNGGYRAVHELTEDEQNADTFDIDFVALNAAQSTNPIIGVSGLYLKVYFSGEFGQVTNEPIPVQFSL